MSNKMLAEREGFEMLAMDSKSVAAPPGKILGDFLEIFSSYACCNTACTPSLVCRVPYHEEGDHDYSRSMPHTSQKRGQPSGDRQAKSWLQK